MYKNVKRKIFEMCSRQSEKQTLINEIFKQWLNLWKMLKNNRNIFRVKFLNDFSKKIFYQLWFIIRAHFIFYDTFAVLWKLSFLICFAKCCLWVFFTWSSLTIWSFRVSSLHDDCCFALTIKQFLDPRSLTCDRIFFSSFSCSEMSNFPLTLQRA